jgi:hypothetical protein
MNEQLRPDDTRDALRKIGGLLLALAALMIFIRKGGDADAWGDFPLFLLLAAPACFFYGGGVVTDRVTGGVRPWQAVYSVIGLIFIPLALFQFIELVDGDAGSSLNNFWIFGLTAAFAFYAGAAAGIRFQLLAGSIALIVSWSALWNEILSDGIAAEFGIYRGLLGILSIILLAGALYLWRSAPDTRVTGTGVTSAGDQGLWKASELLTGAGIAAVLGCSLGISSVLQLASPLGFTEVTTVETAKHWDVLLLLVSLGLVGIGSTIGVRGPVYVGAIGLFLFLLIVGLDLDDDTPERTNFGVWPVVLLVFGALGVLLSGVREASLGDQPRQFVNRLRGR